jgi:hypothetical protein
VQTKVSLKKILIFFVISSLFAGGIIYYFRVIRSDIYRPGEAIVIRKETISPLLREEQYINSRAGFSMHPPLGWKIDESGELGTFAVFVAPEGDIALPANISVIAETKTSNDLEDYVRTSREALPSILQNYNLITNRKVRLGSQDGHVLEGTFTYENLELHTWRLLVVSVDRNYAVTATALESDWEKHKEEMEESLLTFRP